MNIKDKKILSIFMFDVLMDEINAHMDCDKKVIDMMNIKIKTTRNMITRLGGYDLLLEIYQEVAKMFKNYSHLTAQINYMKENTSLVSEYYTIIQYYNKL